jgi:amylosucrase
MVLNHTAKEHAWARGRAAGRSRLQRLLPDVRRRPAAPGLRETLVEVFPDTAPGSFTFYPEIGKWVWTTFNEHQWDLNWANPWVFLEMVGDHARPRESRGRRAALRRGRLHVEADGHALPVRARGPHASFTRCGPRAGSRRPRDPSEEAIVSPAEMLPYLGRGVHDGKEGNLAYHNS